jgi:hypothetical protein
MLSIHLRLGITSGVFPFGTFVLHAPHHHHPRLDNSNFTWRRVQIMKLLVIEFSLSSRHSIPLWPKYSGQHPVLKHPQSIFLP